MKENQPAQPTSSQARATPQRATEAERARQERHAEELLDEALRETFPASDPIAVFVPTDHDADVWHAGNVRSGPS